MRHIVKSSPPNELTEWRLNHKVNEPGREYTYSTMRSNSSTLDSVNRSLYREQGGICAYTEHKITSKRDERVGFHIEHLLPQSQCVSGDGLDTDYKNMVAAWPRPGNGTIPYGAHRKDDWPSQSEFSAFVSPLAENCENSITFNHKGEVSAMSPNDSDAAETINRLGLDHYELETRRKEAIREVLSANLSAKEALKVASKILNEMNRDERNLNRGELVELRQFHSSIKNFLQWKISKLKAICASRNHRLSKRKINQEQIPSSKPSGQDSLPVCVFTRPMWQGLLSTSTGSSLPMAISTMTAMSHHHRLPLTCLNFLR